jgi:hypothetical protein
MPHPWDWELRSYVCWREIERERYIIEREKVGYSTLFVAMYKDIS